jgi:adenosylcobinamide-GDP ribazoletransferase
MFFVIRTFFIALQFLTSVPIRLHRPPSPRETGYSLVHYPFVGLLLGGALALFAWGLATVPSLLAAAVILTVWVLASGCLHLDGLADSADAWVGGHGDRERTLAIMKDPRSGPVAVVMLILVALLKFAALVTLLESHASYLFYILSPVLARAAIPLLLLTTPYVRANGLGSDIVKYQPKILTPAVAVLSLAALIPLLGYRALPLLFIVIMVLITLRQSMVSRLGGTTGDTLGACIEITETAVIAGCALQASFLDQAM